jgi:hypothetical protein
MNYVRLNFDPPNFSKLFLPFHEWCGLLVSIEEHAPVAASEIISTFMSCVIEDYIGWYCCQCGNGPMALEINAGCSGCNNHNMCVKPRLQYLDHIEPPFEPLKPQYLDHVEPLFESPFTPPATPTATTLDPSKFAKLYIRASGIPPQGTADQTTKDAKHSKSMPHVPVKNDFNDTIPDASHHEALLSTDVTIESASSSDDSLESGYSSEEETEALRTGDSACNINQYSLHLLVENGVRSLLSYFCHPTSNESPGEVTGAGNYRSYTYGHTTNAVKVTVPTNSSNETTGHQDRQSGGKRSSAGDGDEDHEDDTKPRKRANKGQDAPDALGSSERRFACFFFKQNPFKYKHRKSCRGPGFSSVSRAK